MLLVTFFNALTGESQRTGTEILNHKLKSLLTKNVHDKLRKQRIIPHPSQMRAYAQNIYSEEIEHLFLSVMKDFSIDKEVYEEYSKQIKDVGCEGERRVIRH